MWGGSAAADAAASAMSTASGVYVIAADAADASTAQDDEAATDAASAAAYCTAASVVIDVFPLLPTEANPQQFCPTIVYNDKQSELQQSQASPRLHSQCLSFSVLARTTLD